MADFLNQRVTRNLVNDEAVSELVNELLDFGAFAVGRSPCVWFFRCSNSFLIDV
jgi:hypothetical protein